MKRIFAVVLAMILMCGFALAEGTQEPQNPDAANTRQPGDFPEAGFTLHLPEEFNHMKGMLMPMGGMEMKPGVYFTMLNYLAMSEEDVLALENETDQEVLTNTLGKALAPLCIVLGFKGDEDIDSFIQSMGGSIGEDDIKLLAKVGDMTFYGIVSPIDGTFEPGFQEEYEAIGGSMDDILANADYYEPINVYASTESTVLSFETTDMDGNPISSAELFARHEYTLVNIWASWCGPCKNELPELEAINGRLADVDCGVVGLLYDGNEEKPRETARAILEETGVTYTVIIAPENVDDLFVVNAFPTTYIVDRNGVIVGEPIVGAYVGKYEPAIMEVLGK